MKKLGVVTVAIVLSACGQYMAVDVSTPAVHVPIGSSQQLTVQLHHAPGNMVAQLSINAPASVTVFPTTLATLDEPQTVTVAAAAGAVAGTSHLTLVVVAGGEQVAVPLDVEVIDPDAFALNMDPPTLTVRQGHSATGTFTVQNGPKHSVTGNVTVSVDSPPAGLTLTGATVMLEGDGAAAQGSLSVTCDASVPVGTQAVTLVATQGSFRAQLPFQVQVIDANAPDFVLDAPATLTVRSGGHATLQAGVIAQMGFTGEVAIAAASQPAGITVGMGTATPDVPAILTVTVAPSVMAGVTTLTLTGSAGSLRQQATVSVQVTDTGTTDTTFGTNGLAALSGLSAPASLYFLNVLPDGSIVAAGNTTDSTTDSATAIVARLTVDGALDPTFGQGGIATLVLPGEWAAVTNVVALDDGSMFVAAYYLDDTTDTYTATLAKLRSDGTVDPTFGQQGLFTETQSSYVLALTVLADGSVLLAVTYFDSTTGAETAAFTKVTSAGTLDTTFGAGGSVVYANAYATATLEYPDGSLVLLSGSVMPDGSETNPQVTLVDASGLPSIGYGTGGSVLLDPGTPTAVGERLHMRPDGTLVVVTTGATDTSFSDAKAVVFQHPPSGTLDPRFGAAGRGKATLSFDGYASALAADGSVVVSGCTGDSSSYAGAVARLSPLGTVDPTFSAAGGDGVAVPAGQQGCAMGVGLQPSGRIVVGGDLGVSLSDGWFVTRLMP